MKVLNRYVDFMKKLDSPLDKEFESIMDEQLETLPYDFSQSFIDGFRLGAKIMLEIYMDDIQNSACEQGQSHI